MARVALIIASSYVATRQVGRADVNLYVVVLLRLSVVFCFASVPVSCRAIGICIYIYIYTYAHIEWYRQPVHL